MQMNDHDSLSALFAPRSIAIVGASATPGKIGGIPLDYALRFGFEGALYAVNPRGGMVQGLPAYPSLEAIGAPVDLAIFAVPQALVPAALDDAVAAGVKGVALFSSGFAEVGPEGAAAQQRLAAKARAAGIRLIGPNCLGFMHLAHKVYATFSPAPGVGRVAPGRIGLVSQSGAFGAYAYSMARERGIGLSLWATTGNEADVQLADCLAWLAQDPGTDVIMAYLEGCRDGPKLRAALALAQAHGKPVVMVKVGTTALGAEAAASHTASLAGNDAVYDAIFRQYGVLRAHTLSEFFDLAASAAIARAPRDRSIGLFTLSGGVGAMMADEASAAGLDVLPLSDAAQQTLRSWVPFAAPRNPVDITGQVTNDLTLMERSAQLMLQDRRFGSWMGFLAAAGASDAFWPVLRALVAGLRASHPETVLAISTLLSPERRAELEALGCLVFADPSVGIRTIAALARHAERPAVPAPATPAVAPLRLPAGTLSEPHSLALLAEAGVSVVEHHLVHTADKAALALTALGGEIALKIASADIPHKSDIGGVALGLRSAAQVRTAFERILASAGAAQPRARVDGVLAARMVRGGVECIAGVHRDPVFGPVLMFGLGGVHVETLRDVSLRALPVTRADVNAMVRELRALPLLQGARGQPAADLESIADMLLALADFAMAAGDTLESAEINPLIARPAAQGGCMAVDALVVGRAVPGTTTQPATQPEETAA
ncbi:MAG: acetate--CoA ligase family protein [Burkholderiaceae bacterium]